MRIHSTSTRTTALAAALTASLSLGACLGADDDLGTAEEGLVVNAPVMVGGTIRQMTTTCNAGNICSGPSIDGITLNKDASAAAANVPFPAYDEGSTWKYRGCGPQAAANVLSFFGIDVPISWAASDVDTIDIPFSDEIATRPVELRRGMQRLLNKYADGEFLVRMYHGKTADDIKLELQKGFAVAALVNNGGHYQVITGFRESTRGDEYFAIDYGHNGSGSWRTPSELHLWFSGGPAWASVIPVGTGGFEEGTIFVVERYPLRHTAPAVRTADHDGDGKADLSLKGIDGRWHIDYSANGFGKWDDIYPGYGGRWSGSIAVPADYDGDHKDDLSVKDAGGTWYIDYAANGFGVWDEHYDGYGPITSIPVPADYDGDGKADLSIKDAGGTWYVNYASDGFATGWNDSWNGYGPATSLPVPGDYDGDRKADLSIKDAGGTWYINYARDGFATGWNDSWNGYGDNSSQPAPADYDGDGKTDISLKGDDGVWHVNYARDGFATGWNDNFPAYGNSTAIAVPADYDGDRKADLSIQAPGVVWYMDFAANGFVGWNRILTQPL